MNISRNVIVLDPTLKIDEVDMSYKSFIVQFSGLIIKKIIKDKGWTIVKASNFLKSKFMYDEYIYGIMQEIVTERDVKFILNRNPTITYGSILLMKIRKIKPDSDDMTLAIPSAILPGLNADFDGDELNSLGLSLEELETFFKGFSPVNMLINRTDQTIKLDISPLENVSLAIFSDR